MFDISFGNSSLGIHWLARNVAYIDRKRENLTMKDFKCDWEQAERNKLWGWPKNEGPPCFGNCFNILPSGPLSLSPSPSARLSTVSGWGGGGGRGQNKRSVTAVSPLRELCWDPSGDRGHTFLSRLSYLFSHVQGCIQNACVFCVVVVFF